MRAAEILRENIHLIHAIDMKQWSRVIDELHWVNNSEELPPIKKRYLKALINQHKQEIIYYILNAMKTANAYDVKIGIPDSITSLRALGLNWPELDIIQKSLYA